MESTTKNKHSPSPSPTSVATRRDVHGEKEKSSKKKMPRTSSRSRPRRIQSAEAEGSPSSTSPAPLKRANSQPERPSPSPIRRPSFRRRPSSIAVSKKTVPSEEEPRARKSDPLSASGRKPKVVRRTNSDSSTKKTSAKRRPSNDQRPPSPPSIGLKRQTSRGSNKAASRWRGDAARSKPNSRDLLLDTDSEGTPSPKARSPKTRSSRTASPMMQRTASFRIRNQPKLFRTNSIGHTAGPRGAGLRTRNDRLSRIQRASSFRNPRSDSLSNSWHANSKTREQMSHRFGRSSSLEEEEETKPQQEDENDASETGYDVPFFQDAATEDNASTNVAALAQLVMALQKEVSELRRELTELKSVDGSSSGCRSPRSSNRPIEPRRSSLVTPLYDARNDSDSEDDDDDEFP